jgi:hypothetical protein
MQIGTKMVDKWTIHNSTHNIHHNLNLWWIYQYFFIIFFWLTINATSKWQKITRNPYLPKVIKLWIPQSYVFTTLAYEFKLKSFHP